MDNEKITPSLGDNPGAPKEVTPSVQGSARGGDYHIGVINAQIGTGDNAKDSFVWMTLIACFWIAGIMSFFVFLFYANAFSRKEITEINAITGAMKDVWSIFTPIITLALGYAFGKRDRSE